MSTNDRTALLIKIGAVLTSAPRWIEVGLIGDGLHLPEEWLSWWLTISAILYTGMALVEALAFAYALAAAKRSSGRQLKTLYLLVGISAVLFVGVQTAHVAAKITNQTIGEFLQSDLAVGWWAFSLCGSSIAILATTGYAQLVDKPDSEHIIKSEALPGLEKMFVAEEEAGAGPEIPGQLVEWPQDYRFLTLEQKRVIVEVDSSAEIAKITGVTPRTASNWLAKARQELGLNTPPRGQVSDSDPFDPSQW